MPKYFFQITKDGVERGADESLELADIDAAWEEATLTAGETLKDMDGSLRTGSDWLIEIQNERREKLRSITISAREWKSE